MDAMSDPAIHEIWFMKSAQIGWTEILNNIIGFYIDLDPAPILLVQPSLVMGAAWSKDRFAPMVRDTPCLREKIADPKARDSGNTVLHKKFTGGHLTVAGANSPAGLASRPIRIVLFDEVDRFPPSAGTEGDPISLGKKRSTTFWNRKMLAGGTPTTKGESRVEEGFGLSDQRYYFVPCPHCNEFQRLLWANVRWPDDRPQDATYVCAYCAREIEEKQKIEMLRRGSWRATKTSVGICGFHISEIYSPWVSWEKMVRGFLEAKKFPETLKTWINTSLGETWEDQSATPAAEGLLARRESYTPETLPAGVLLITMGTDVQDDRLEWTIYGWGAEEECWRLGHGILRGDPGGSALWAEHDDVLRRRFPTDDGRNLVIEACAVDSGGHFTEHVYAYCQKRKRNRVWAIKGKEGIGRLVWPKRATATKNNAQVWIIGVDTAKDLIYQRLNKFESPGPGFVHFDADTTQDWLDQLTSETVTYKMVAGRKVRQFKPKPGGVRQEGLDTTVYAYAAMIGRGGGALLAARTKAHAKPVKALEPTVSPTESVSPTPAEQPQQTPVTQVASSVRGVKKSRGPQRSAWIGNWRK